MNNQQQINEAMELKNKRIQKAISHRDQQICFFNATNNAIQMALADKSLSGGNKTYQELIKEWREWFIKEWQEWYLENYDLEEDNQERAF